MFPLISVICLLAGSFIMLTRAMLFALELLIARTGAGRLDD